MKIGVISDTHGDVHSAREAVRLFQRLEVEQVLHCGDIGSAEIVGLFSDWPTHFVYGNVDSPTYLRDAIRQAGQICHDRFGSIELDGRKIALLHGNDTGLLEKSAKSGKWHVICHGHTHTACHSTVGKTLVLNPGAIARTIHPSVALVDLQSLEVTPIRL
ncbi:MAG: YfcE family phosphodiesterase [Planctomycetota bacterium]|nr:YfcE family phosphodiesterase [Planctomycetota bacterium]